MTGIALATAATLLADELVAVLGPDANWITPTWVRDVIDRQPRCRSCRRPIRAARSLNTGYGPVCRSRLAGRGDGQ
jgi:hypothetical protein